MSYGNLQFGQPSMTGGLAEFLKMDQLSLQSQERQKVMSNYSQNLPTNIREEAAGQSLGLAQPAFSDSPEGANYRGKSMTDAQLLDSIARNEGTYKSGYNTEFAYGANGSKRDNFNNMSIDDVMAYQDTMSGRSTAAGRYQMLKQTIADEKRFGNYKGDEKFTDKMQDDMIMQRLKRVRGYDDWRSGSISDDKFTSKLSKEFASVNNPYTGTGHYGQGSKNLMWD